MNQVMMGGNSRGIFWQLLSPASTLLFLIGKGAISLIPYVTIFHVLMKTCYVCM